MTISRFFVGAILATTVGFRVVAEVALPADYAALEWIASTGTQFIDTGHTHGANVRVACEISATAVGSYACVFGSRAGGYGKTDNALGFFVRWSSANRPTLEYGPAGKTDEGVVYGTDNTFPYDERVSIVYENKTVTWTGQTRSGSITTTLTKSPAGLNPMMIFDTNSGSVGGVKNETNYATMRLYSFTIREGDALKRDFVPCRNALGEAGLWDKVEGRFHGNVGKGVFLASDRPQCRLNYIRSTGTQFIDTGYTHAANVRIECEAAVTAAGNYACIFGSREGGWAKSDTALGFFVRWGGNNVPNFEYGGAGLTDGNTAGTANTFPYDERVRIVYENKTLTWTGVTKSGSLTSKWSSTPAGKNPMMLFDTNSGAAGTVKNETNLATMKLYSFRALENGVVKCDIVPARAADGKVGVLDLADTSGNAFHPNLGTGDFTYGYAYEPTATGVAIYDGVVEAADGLATVAVAKAGRDSITITAPTFASFALQEGEAKFTGETTVGALTLTGGARLAFEVSGDGNGRVVASSVAFAEATAERPVRVAANLQGVSSLSAARVLIAGAQLAAADLAKFQLCETAWPVALAIQDGNLVLAPVEEEAQTLPAGYTLLEYVESTGTQFVDTEFVHGFNTIVDLRGGFSRVPTDSLWWCFCGGRTAQKNADQFGMFMETSGSVPRFHVSVTSAAASKDLLPVEAGRVYLFHLDRNGPSTVDGVWYDTGNGNATAYPFYLFASSEGNSLTSPGQVRIYSCKIMTRTTVGAQLERDFVPCRNPLGEAGFWDFVTGKFYGNQGTGRLLGSDETGAYLNYAASDGRQKVKLDYEMDVDTTVKFSFGHPVYQADTALFGLSWTSSCYLFVQQSDLFRFYGSGVQLTSVGKPDANARYSFEVGDDNVVSLRKEKTSLSVGTADSRSVANSTADLYLTIFACNAGHPSAYRFYSMEIGKGGGSPRTVTPQRRLLPYRNENGLVGLKDEISGTFYPNTGTAALSYGYAFNTFEGGITIYDGVVDEEDALSTANIVKEGPLALNLGVLAQVASLDVRAGEVDLVDAAARTLTVAGPLTLAGGTRLAFDVLPGGSDGIAASAINLAGVTAENPVTLTLVQKGGGTFSETGALVLLSGGLVAGDEAKFRVEGLPAVLSVSNGSLVATLPDDVPYTAEWIGKGDRTNLADSANWRCLNFAGRELAGVLPTTASAIIVGANTTFCCPRGQTLDRRELVIEDEVTLAADCDWRGLDLPIDFTINLHGHKLYLSRLDGKGTITDAAAGYQLLEYISSSGTQYVDTGYKYAANVRIECEASVTASGSYACIFGSRTGGWAKSDTALGFFVRWGGSNVPNLEYGPAGKTGGNIAGTADTFPYDERVMIVYENKTVTWTGRTKSGSLSSSWSATPAGQNTMLLFDTNSGAANALKNETNYATMQFYSFKALENGEVVCHLVPARRRSDGALGVLDLANGNAFRGSLGTGALTAGPAVAAESAFAAGELHLDVPADVTVDNSTVALTGSLKLVKEGEGTFNPLFNNQTYFGGTDLRAGSLTVNAQGTTHRFGAPGSEIHIGEGATLDMAAYYDFYDYSFVLDGGTLKSSTSLASDWTKAMISAVRVTEENARLDFNQYGILGSGYRPTILDLQGHRLDVNFQGNCYFVNTLATKGTLAIHGPVEFYHGSFMGPETTLDIDGKLLVNAVDVHVGTYIARSTTNACAYNGNLYVYQRFVPLTDNFWGCILKNGAVLDLSSRADVWNTTGALVSDESTFTKKTVAFEEGAVIGVDVGERRLRDGLQLAAWAEQPDATFKLLDHTAYKLQATREGLFCIANGTILFVR